MEKYSLPKAKLRIKGDVNLTDGSLQEAVGRSCQPWKAGGEWGGAKAPVPQAVWDLMDKSVCGGLLREPLGFRSTVSAATSLFLSAVLLFLLANTPCFVFKELSLCN